MKKIICITLSICLTAIALCGCSKQGTAFSSFSEDVIVEEIIIDNTSSSSEISSNGSITTDNSSATNSSGVTSGVCSHSYNETVKQTAALFKAGVKKYTCTKCGDSYTKAYPVEKLKILAIGNSFSLNSMWNLYDICKQAGVKQIDIAIMYIGGCSLDKHWEGAQNNSTEYRLYRNNSGKWKITPNYTLEAILKEGGWDIITLQQKSEHAGDNTKFSNLDNMVNYVTDKCPDAKILWNMTWAFTKDSKYMPNQHIYNYDDITMYKKIAECAQNIVLQNKKIHSIVPTGTAVMNARTSGLKNQVHQDDGSHLSEDVGYYVGAFTWFGAITGMSIYDVNYIILNPTVSANMNVFIESAENALKNPYSITPSRY